MHIKQPVEWKVRVFVFVAQMVGKQQVHPYFWFQQLVFEGGIDVGWKKSTTEQFVDFFFGS